MTISTLDPTTALLVVDLQKGITGLPTAHPMKDVVDNAVALLDAFRSRCLPVVPINVDDRAPGRAVVLDRGHARQLERVPARTEPADERSRGHQADLGRLHQHRSGTTSSR